MPPVRVRKILAAALLLLAAAMGPGLAWAGAHVHHDDHEADSARDLAEVLVHGHEHQERTPDHEHSLLPSPAVRQDGPRNAEVSGVAPLEAGMGETLSLSGTSSAWQLPRIAGPSPPILHLLCTLLI